MSLERFIELRKRGFVNLPQPEKDEYRTLKAQFANEIAATDESHAEETLSISRIELSRMIQDAVEKERDRNKTETRALEAVVGINSWREKGPQKDIIRTATLRKYQKDSESPEALIIDWKFHKMEWDEDTRRHNKAIYKVKLKYPDGNEETIELPLTRFAELKDYATVKILKQTKKEFEQISGFVRRRPKKDGYAMHGEKYPGGEKIPLSVIREEYICEVQLPDGKTLEVSADRLNA